jgi:hypothetical protein
MTRLSHNSYLAWAVASVLGLLAPGIAGASPQILECVLTDIETKGAATEFESRVGAERRSITVIFDDDAGTLGVEAGGVSTPLNDVTISQTSMNGAADDISLGVDRSSWRIVFQTYTADLKRSEFGSCIRKPQADPDMGAR